MNKTETLKSLWQVIESRDRVVRKTYQKIEEFSAENTRLQTENTNLQTENTRLQGSLEELWEEKKNHIKLIEELRVDVQQLTVTLQINQTKQESLQHIIEQKDATIEDVKTQLNRSEENRMTLWQEIDQLQEQLNESRAIIEGMESSKFWQLRENFLKLKQLLQSQSDKE